MPLWTISWWCGHDTGSFVAYLPQARGQRYAAACEELDRLHRRGVVFAAERDDEAAVVQVTGIAFQHLDAVARGDEFDREDTAFFEFGSGRPHICLELREIAVGVIGQEGVGRNTACPRG